MSVDSVEPVNFDKDNKVKKGQKRSLIRCSVRRCSLTFRDVFSITLLTAGWLPEPPHAVVRSSNPNEGTLLLCISVHAVSVDVLTHAVDLHKTASC